MGDSKIVAGLIAATCLAGTCLAAKAAEAAPASAPAAKTTTYVAKRDAFGRPSLEGMWGANFLMTLQAGADAKTLTVPESEATALFAARSKKAAAFFERSLDPEVPLLLPSVDGLPLVRGERRTRLITLPADGKLPLTPAGRKEMEADGPAESFDNPEDRPNSERCTVGNGQPPFVFLTFGDQLQILQTRDAVVLHSEYGDMMRVIPFTDRHGPAIFESKAGDSIARWQGDTLMIETVRLPDKDRGRFFPSFIVSSEATVVERLTRVSAKELLYQFTVIDPRSTPPPGRGSSPGTPPTSSCTNTPATRETTPCPASSPGRGMTRRSPGRRLPSLVADRPPLPIEHCS